MYFNVLCAWSLIDFGLFAASAFRAKVCTTSNKHEKHSLENEEKKYDSVFGTIQFETEFSWIYEKNEQRELETLWLIPKISQWAHRPSSIGT